MKQRKSKKKIKIAKHLFLFTSSVIILVMVSLGIYQTYAALTDRDKVQNDFRVGNIQTEIEEEFTPPNTFVPDKVYEKKVVVKNTGEQDIFVRVLALPSIIKKQDNGSVLLLPATSEGTNPILSIDYNLTDWIDGKDGYFYYKKKVAKAGQTTVLFTKVQMNQANITEDYTDASLTFEIKAEAIGITKFAYRDAWWNAQIPSKVPLLDVDNLLKGQTSNS
ncbi:hypothetical protein [Enterococcus termitis]|uniref:Alternate signal-mediated exported protein n=1 Tax=Enterococcus termitis TaxID=332950 RepID=A0A1E5G8Z6_9ENTE|nr:hypothetical protein [Enterococcus termitis]OEG09167.1 hypothetical protein BCR25_11390 [Enterococcus termitis]OJG98624.1 alternate signal-mediated exported protein [Enterococcus termitis]